MTLLDTTFLILGQVYTIREIASICGRSSDCVVWQERIPLCPRTPPVSEIGSGEVLGILFEECTIVLVVVEVLLYCMYFAIQIGTGDNASLEHNM